MTPRARRAATVAGVTAAGSLSLALAGSLLVAPDLVQDLHSPTGGNNVETLVAVVAFSFAFPILGYVIVRRLPANPLGWIYLAIGAFEALNLFAGAYSSRAYAAGGDLPLAAELSWVAVWAWVPAFTLFSTVAILLFPTGRLPSARWWPVIAIATIAFVPLFVPVAITTWPYRGLALEAAQASNVAPPLDSAMATAFVIQNLAQFLLLVAMIGSVAGLVARFRHGRATERQQLKWFMFGAVVDVAILMSWILFALQPLVALATGVAFGLALPIAIWIAISRYRLYEIDRIVSRTVGWAIVTGLLVAVFAGLVVALQALLAPVTRESTLAVAASTLVAFALFQPLRRRVQRGVDRRFDRARYDGQRTVDAFAEHLRNEVDLGTIRSSLTATAGEAVRPVSAGVWLRAGTSPHWPVS